MCRIAAHVGPPLPLSWLLYDAPVALQELAHSPAEMRSGTVNVDGTGIVWFDDAPGPDGAVDRRPLRYRTQLPPWGDQTLVELAPRLRSRVALGAVRSTTPGIPQGQAFVHPFTAGGLAGTHNGLVEDFRTAVARPLLAEVGDRSLPLLDGMSDANVLFLLAHDAYVDGADLVAAARHATDVAVKVCESRGVSATLTLVLADAGGVAAVNAATGRPANSLYVHSDGEHHLLASEPLDPDLAWRPVPEGAAAVLTPTSLEVA